MKAFFLFAISPVQPLIAQSRKTLDLYNGSFLLSHLCNVGIKALKSYPVRSEVIFPHESIATKPNRFMALIDGNEADFKSLGEHVQKEIQNEWNKIGNTVLEHLKLEHTEDFDRQMNTYFEYHWLIYPVKRLYHEDYREAEKALGIIKGVRKFLPLDESGRKCELTGEHNVLYFRGSRRLGMVSAIPVPDHVDLRYVGPEETLGAIGLVKRASGIYLKERYPKEYVPFFPSTSDIALMHLIYTALEKLKINLDEIDSQYIFALKENAKPDDHLDETVIENTKKVYRQILEYKKKITPYYALIVFDGDNMGKWFSGAYIKDKSKLKDFQNTLSFQLGKYAAKVRNILKPPKGQVVYAGGDDLLGFINLQYFFEVIKELRDAFEQIDLTEFTDRKLTFSAGIAIAHYKEPLTYVLKRAREAEEKAKNNARDSLAITLVKRAGATVETVYKWKDLDGQWTIDYMSNVLSQLESHFSDQFIRTFQVEMLKVLDREEMEWTRKYPLEYIMWKEFKRLMTRSYLLKHNDEREKITQVSCLSQNLNKLFTVSQNCPAASKKVWSNFFSLLNILMFMERERKDELTVNVENICV